MIASLGMYDMPHARDAYDRFWDGIRDALGYGPEKLDRTHDSWGIWQSPDLLLAQTCGLPFRARLYGQVTLVGTPDYGLRDCPSGYYYSYIIRRRGDDRDLRSLARSGILAYNDGLSQSGWAAPVAAAGALNLTVPATLETGAHVASIHAVLERRADFAGIDAITYLMWQHANPETARGIETFIRTDPTPGLPLITAKGRDPAPIAHAVRNAIAQMSASDRDILHLKGLARIDADTYRALPIPAMP
ncbi:PhnD/SsuA/transferrin family substrate-binding protein [uncultured Tateyamaria sp.]|uniref:phosphate/phosphite/phosphonate ABC transporter substrate-binding protein n=1 Tax=uncultured Tateyamaria sp. TaxID=455651 RepID=UPI0026039752|nr:PhnD/SsuA/transferrin family substrate-binding protein [uncultured Tateyamaria sp.]